MSCGRATGPKIEGVDEVIASFAVETIVYGRFLDMGQPPGTAAYID